MNNNNQLFLVSIIGIFLSSILMFFSNVYMIVMLFSILGCIIAINDEVWGI